MSRTEEQIVAQAPILVHFGSIEYKVKPLVIKDAREWRKKLADMMGQLSPAVNATTDNPKQFQEGINSLFVSMPDKIIELVFDYGKDLPKDAVEAVATDEEMAQAFESILEVAFPLARSMVGATAKLSQ